MQQLGFNTTNVNKNSAISKNGYNIYGAINATSVSYHNRKLLKASTRMSN